MPLLARITLWAWVVVAGVLLGGGIFETVVLTPCGPVRRHGIRTEIKLRPTT